MNEITITFDNGKKKCFHRGITLKQVIETIFPDIYLQVIAGIVDDQILDLTQTVENDANIRVLTSSDPEGLQVFWHSASHVMAHAVKDLHPDARLGIGPAISNGFYYDFGLNTSLTETDLSEIESRMQEIVDDDIPFSRNVLTKKEASELFQERGETLFHRDSP